MKRIIMVCKGPTEQAFVKRNLEKLLLSKGIVVHTPLIKATRGGIAKWPALKHQIETHLKSEVDAYVTTFIDYYGVSGKHAFPGWEASLKVTDKNLRVASLERAMRADIDPRFQNRFIPYIQLHEFESLLFNDINVFYQQIPDADIIGKAELEITFADYDNPEMINDNKLTSPSHRLQRIIRGYNKVVYGDILSEAIGISRIRAKSPRFNDWLTVIENI